MFVAGLILLELIVLLFLSRWFSRTLARLLLAMTKSQGATVNILSFLFLPGIIIHELSHLLVASLLFVPVGEIEFMPVIEEKGVKLGSVAVGKTDPIRRLIIGLAPVLIGIAILIAMEYYMQNNLMVQIIELQVALLYLLYIYILFVVGNTMFSSRKDLEGFVGVVASLALVGVALSFAVQRVGISLPQITLPLNTVESVFLPIAQALGVVLVLDAILLIMLRGALHLLTR